MGHLYEVHLSDGQSHTVETPHHHADHDDETFAKHLLDILKATVSGIFSQAIMKIIYRGAR